MYVCINLSCVTAAHFCSRIKRFTLKDECYPFPLGFYTLCFCHIEQNHKDQDASKPGFKEHPEGPEDLSL